jgi:hypothetical protein
MSEERKLIEHLLGVFNMHPDENFASWRDVVVAGLDSWPIEHHTALKLRCLDILLVEPLLAKSTITG